jgi:hypothetical protein
MDPRARRLSWNTGSSKRERWTGWESGSPGSPGTSRDGDVEARHLVLRCRAQRAALSVPPDTLPSAFTNVVARFARPRRS